MQRNQRQYIIRHNSKLFSATVCYCWKVAYVVKGFVILLKEPGSVVAGG
jgi:hypothetical protein